MEVSVENTGGLARRMTVQVPAERVDQEVQSRLRSMAQTVRLEGFRPGKVPLKLIEQKFGKQVRMEVVDKITHATLQEALSQNSIRPVGMPSVETTQSLPGEPLEYIATFEIFPDLEGALKFGFPVSRPAVEITEDDISGMLENLRRQRASWSGVDRPSRSGDQVVIDFEGSIDGAAFPGNKASDMPLVLGSGNMIQGFEAQLEGLSAGDERSLTVTFPDDYHSAGVAGKEAVFKVTVKSVAEMVLPALDDTFAQAFGIADGGMQGLREEVTRNMQRELKGLVGSKLKEQVFNSLLTHNPVDIPRKLIEEEVKALESQPDYQQRPLEELEALAVKRIKLGVIASEIARQNQIQLDADRVRERVEIIASSYEKPEEVIQWYYGNQEMLNTIQTAVIEEQVMEWIIEHGDVEVMDKPMSFNELVEEARQTQGK